MTVSGRLTAEDKHEILELLHRYVDAIDRSLFDSYPSLYTSDATLDFTAFGMPPTPVDVSGHLDYLREALPGLRMQHLIGNTIFEEESADRARTRSDVLAHVVGTDGKLTIMAVRYSDDLRKVDGRWLVERRVGEKNFIHPEGDG